MASLSAARQAAKDLWLSLSLPEASLSRLRFSGDPDIAIDSSFRLGVAAQATTGLSGLSAAHFHKLRTGVEQDVAVDARHAVISFHSEAWYTLDGRLPVGDAWDPIAGLYRTRGDGFVRIHTNFPHHRSGVLNILDVPDSPATTREDVSKALRDWDAVEFETEAARRGMCVTALRSFKEWDAHPQAKALLGAPPVTLHKIGDAPKREVAQAAMRPLDGIRVLDLSRVLAGPIAGRALGAQGADVLLVTSPNLPILPLLDIETSLGKRTTQLDLTHADERNTLTRLAADADVFLQAYRPGGLEEQGFGSKKLARLRPGIVCANLCAWGWEGPWKDRRGFDSLVQTATGFNVAEGEAFGELEGSGQSNTVKPRALPMQALDHAAGYFLAFGINAALCRTITEGGSWEVRVSLAAVGQWLRSLGRVSPRAGQPFPPRVFPPHSEIVSLSIPWRQSKEGGGRREMTAVKHAAVLERTPAREGPSGEAPMGLDVHTPTWLPRNC
ncbi:putative coA-transferase family III [Lyophyllum shimeji]|uniref:CoA-transferase family III n=1 Tax=Lyophyllum shimeji TaxID=47721 RepID=A0A9P3UWW5_LYOSH|nr:putative coA-transferase family III [Lyophyllum shimeji]